MKAIPYTVLLVLLWGFTSSAYAQSIYYTVHLEGIGWAQGFFTNGEVAGTTGQNRRMEAIAIYVEGLPPSCKIKYKAYVQGIGWLGWVYGGTRSEPYSIAGTMGQSRRMEAVRIQLGDRLEDCGWSVYYKVHVQGIGWMLPVKDGAQAGTTKQSRRMEAIRIWLQRK